MDTLTDLRKIRDDLEKAAEAIEVEIKQATSKLKNNRKQQKQIARIIEFMEAEEGKAEGEKNPV